MSDHMPSTTKKPRVIKIATTPVVSVDLTTPDLVTIAEPTESAPTESAPTESAVTESAAVVATDEQLDDEQLVIEEPVVGKAVEMWRGIELEPVKTDMPSLESEGEVVEPDAEAQAEADESESDMPPLCSGNCDSCDCSALKKNKGATILAAIEKALENHLNPDVEHEDEDADDEGDDTEDINTRTRTISDTIKETIENHLVETETVNDQATTSKPNYRLILGTVVVALGLWRLYASVSSSTNARNEL